MTFAKRTLAALAVVAMFGLMTSSASAAVTTSLSVNNGSATNFSGTTNGSSGGITYTVSSSVTDTSSTAGLQTNTLTLNNTGSGSATITLLVTGSGYSFGGSSVPATGSANYSLSGTAGPGFNGAADSASFTGTVGSTTLNPNPANASVTGSGPGTGSYTFTPGSSSPLQNVNLGGAAFAIGEKITITLGAGDTSQFTETIGVFPNAVPPPGTPEPSTLALAGLGTLGFVAYGLRRRKARTA